MARKLVVEIVGDSRSFEKSLKQADQKAGKFSKGLKALKFAAFGAAAGGTVLLAKGLKDSASAALEAEKAQTRLKSALKGANVSYSKQGKAIDKAITKTSKLAALDDEELSDSFANLVRTTGSVTKATEGMALAADIARARNVSLEAATRAIEKTYLTGGKALRRFGITMIESTANADELKGRIDKLRDSLKGKTAAQRVAIEAQIDELKTHEAAAKQLDKMKSGQDALASAQKKFAGAAKAYGESAAGAQDKLAVAFENLQEKVGQKLLPVLQRLALRLIGLIEWAETNWPRFASAAEQAFGRIKPAIDKVIGAVKGVVAIIDGIRKGDWSKAWEGYQKVVKVQIDAVKLLLGKAIPALFKLGQRMSEAIIKGILSGPLKDVPAPLKKAIGLGLEQITGVAGLKGLRSIGGAAGNVAGAAHARAAGLGGGTVVVQNHLVLDGKIVAQSTTRHQQRGQQRNPRQKRGGPAALTAQ